MSQQHSNHEITEAMITFGGGFMRSLGMLFRQADRDNQRRLLLAFPEYWQQYDELAALLEPSRVSSSAPPENK